MATTWNTLWQRSGVSVPLIEQRIARAAQNMSAVIDAGTGVPYFGVALMAERPHFYHVDFFDLPHLAGRAADALLMAEAVAGTTVDAGIVDAYRGLLLRAFDGPDHLNGFVDPGSGRRRVLFHNLREGLLGLTALIQARNDKQAAGAARDMMQRLLGLMNADGSWNLDEIRKTPGLLMPGEVAGHDAFYCSTGGRLIGALVKYYEVTGNPDALELASRAKEQVLVTCFAPDGKYTQAAGWHVHSVTATINSLAQLAECTGDKALMERTRKIYLASFDGLVTHFGWSKENLSNDLETGEVNNTGDIVQTALILARNGHPECYSDAEKMMRSHVLPSQLLDTSWVKEVADPCGDNESGVRARSLGAFGFPAPYGHKIDRVPAVNFNFDITCGAMQALCEVLRNACTVRPGEVRINLLFPLEAPGVKMVSHLPNEGLLEIETSGTTRLLVRMPEGVAPASATVAADGKPVETADEDGWLAIAAGAGKLSIRFDLPEKQTEEKLAQRTARLWWKGEQVVRMEPKAEFLPFF